MGTKTRLSVEPSEVPSLLGNVAILSLIPPEEIETPEVVEIETIKKFLQTEFDNIEGILALPSDETKSEFAVVFNLAPPLEGDEEVPTSLSRVLQQFKFEVEIEGVKYKARSRLLYEVDHSIQAQVIKNLTNAMVEGEPLEEEWYWLGNEKFSVASTPKPTEPVEPVEPEPVPAKDWAEMVKLVGQLQGQLNELKASKGSALDTSLSKELGETLAKQNQTFIQELADKGILSSQAPKIEARFSGDNLKGDSTYETWEYEISQLVPTHTEIVVKRAINTTLRGSALDSLRYLGPLKETKVEDILSFLRSKYGICSALDVMWGEFFSTHQAEGESISVFTRKIEAKLRDMNHRFPHAVRSEAERQEKLRDRLFYGCNDEIRSHILFKYEDKAPYKELADLARRLEDANNKRAKELGKQIKPKTQVKTEVVQNSSMDPTLAKMISLAKQCELEQATNKSTIKSLNQAWKDYEQRNNSQHVPYDQRDHNQGQGQGRGSNGNNGSSGRGRGYQGRNYDPNHQQNRGGMGRGTGRGRGRPIPDQSQNFQYFRTSTQSNGQQNSNSNSNSNGNQDRSSNGGNQRRTPFCHFCNDQGFPATDHWPRFCEFLKSLISEHRNNQSANGHTGNNDSLNSSELS